MGCGKVSYNCSVSGHDTRIQADAGIAGVGVCSTTLLDLNAL